jgi:hypothetical protein
MSIGAELTAAEFGSVQEVAKGINQGVIPGEHSVRLLELRLVYKLLGDLRITAAGRTRIERLL